VCSVIDIVVAGDSYRSKRLEISGYILSIGSNAIGDFLDYAKERRASESRTFEQSLANCIFGYLAEAAF
jgi:hypothetical protein